MNDEDGLIKLHTTFANIHDPLVLLSAVIESRSSFTLTDMAVSAEGFFAQILNIAYELNLETVDANEAVIDLLDKHEAIAFQVTVNGSRKKIQDKLNGYSKSTSASKSRKGKVAKKVEFAKKLRFLIISQRQKNGYPGLAIPNSLDFDEVADILDINALVEHIKRLKDDKQEKIAEYVLSMLPWYKRLKEMVTVHTDLQALNEYRNKFDHSAFHDPWEYEGSFIRFQRALDEFIALLKCGRFEGKIVTKRMDDCSDHGLKKLLDEVFKQVRKRRQEYTAISGGKAIYPDEQLNYQSSAIRQRLDDGKQAVIDALNNALVVAVLEPLPGVDPI